MKNVKKYMSIGGVMLAIAFITISIAIVIMAAGVYIFFNIAANYEVNREIKEISNEEQILLCEDFSVNYDENYKLIYGMVSETWSEKVKYFVFEIDKSKYENLLLSDKWENSTCNSEIINVGEFTYEIDREYFRLQGEKESVSVYHTKDGQKYTVIIKIWQSKISWER